MAWAFVTSVHEPPPQGGSPVSLRARAMRLLARREHSREELRRKLAPKVQEGEDLDATLDALMKEGWLSDARFAEISIRAKARRFGPRMLVHQLRGKGVGEEEIAQAFRAAGEEGASSIEKVWASRFHAPATNDREKARQVRFLQARGFALEDIFRYLKTLKVNP
jgi:regulatory protein